MVGLNNRNNIKVIVYGIGGSTGNLVNSFSQPNFSLGHSILSGMVAAIILGALVEYKFKHPFNIHTILAIALAGGLSSNIVFSGVKNIVSLPFQVQELRTANSDLSGELIKTNTQIALTSRNAATKEKAIAQIAEVANEGNRPEEGINAIKEIARKTKNSNIRTEAVVQLNSIVEENHQTAQKADQVISNISIDSSDILLLLDTLYNEVLVSDKTGGDITIKRMVSYFNHSLEVDLAIAKHLENLHELGKNDLYLLEDGMIKAIALED